MKHALALILLATAGAAQAVPGGTLGTLLVGTYMCEVPGDASGALGEREPEADFIVTNDSGYRTAKGAGVYLLTGDRVVLTSGPLRGEQYHRITDRFLRKIGPDGKDSRIRCVLRMANNNR